MSLLILAFKNIRQKALSSLLSVLLFGFGIGIILLILLVSTHLKNDIEKNASGVDLVIGAKGSPMQLILANIFHVDFPTGNISLKESAELTRNRLIKSAIPVSLGDSHKGYRIVGTTPAYMALYEASFAEGAWSDTEMQAFVGAEVASYLQLSIGDTFASTHGLAETGAAHGEHPFIVAGILEPTGAVIDKLILTSVESVWHVHSHGDNHEDHTDSMHAEKKIPWMGLTVNHEQFEEEEITAVLLQYASPMAAIRLPQQVNKGTNFQAASPAFETARLFSLIGSGVEVVNILGIVIIIISAVSVFIALLNSLKERKYELAIMRSMGASRGQLFFLICIEGFLLTVLGMIFGFTLGHGGIMVLNRIIGQLDLDGFVFVDKEWEVLIGAMIVGVISAIIPAIMAFKTDISKTLAKA